MTNSVRLFDLLDQYRQQFPNKQMLFNKVSGSWVGLTAEELFQQSQQVAASLIELGVSPGNWTPETQDKVGILSDNCSEWMVIDFAVQQTGGVLVPIYPSISNADLTYILNESAVRILFIADKFMYKKVKAIRQDVPTLEHVFCFKEVEGVAFWKTLLQPIQPEQQSQIDAIRNQINPETLFTIIYTSGTTGNPKGVMLNHRNVGSNATSSVVLFNFCSSDEKVLSFLPLNHIFERTVMYIYIAKGVSVYFAEGMETIGPNLREVQPVVFTTVPRLLEKVYERIEAKGQELTGIKRKLFFWALDLAEKFEINNQSLSYKIQWKIADKLIYSKWREAVGGNIKAIITGSAACQVRLARIFTAAQIIIMEGYGLTETSPVVTVNTFQPEGRAFGSVGATIDGVDVKIAEDGEILCKGPNIMMGYYKHLDQTQEAIKDGWFHTGDIGIITEQGFLKITDRKKEIFKLSAGKYIAPLPIENKMKESPFIEQIMVVGSNQKFAGALIVPAKDKIMEYFAKQENKTIADGELCQDKDVLKLIRKELDKFNAYFAAHEHVKKFQLLANEWTIDGGELTPTLKIKRKKIMEKYGDIVDRIYA
ncbi:MAG: AMP-dependent synthetase/ligase [Chitinophagaceae bacterium]